MRVIVSRTYLKNHIIQRPGRHQQAGVNLLVKRIGPIRQDHADGQPPGGRIGWKLKGNI